MLKVRKSMDPLPTIDSGQVTVQVEGEIKTDRPDGIRPKSIFVRYDSAAIDFQFSILEFHHNGTHYVPSKTGTEGSSYSISVDRSNLPSEAFEDPEYNDESIAELSDIRICGILYPSLFHGAVLPAYNEWRYRRDLEWGESWGSSSRKYDYRPQSIK